MHAFPESGMPKHPVKLPRRAVREADSNPVEVIEASAGRRGFVSFSYTRTEITTHGSGAYLRAQSTRLENGKLTSESLEGELEGGAYDALVRQTQRHVARQAAQFFQALALFLPFSTKRPTDRD